MFNIVKYAIISNTRCTDSVQLIPLISKKTESITTNPPNLPFRIIIIPILQFTKHAKNSLNQINFRSSVCAGLAQQAEQLPRKEKSGGSNPPSSSIHSQFNRWAHF